MATAAHSAAPAHDMASVHAAQTAGSEEQDDNVWRSRLVWAHFRPSHVGNGNFSMLWPAVMYADVTEYNSFCQKEAVATKNFNFRAKLAMHIIKLQQEQAEAALLGDSSQASSQQGLKRIVRFLGRPLGDYREVEDRECYQFFEHFAVVNKTALTPQIFAGYPPQLYMDFHQGLEESVQIMGSDSAAEPYTKKAPQFWKAYWEKKGKTPPTLRIPKMPSIALQTSFERIGETIPSPPSSPHEASIAAVSVDQESALATPATHQDGLADAASVASRSLAGSSLASSRFADQADQFPRLDEPLGQCSWRHARNKLGFAGWKSYLDHRGDYRYHCQVGSNATEYSDRELQQIALDFYGWEPSGEDMASVAGASSVHSHNHHYHQAPQTPPAHRSRKRVETTTPQTIAKDYSFGVLWQHNLELKGWKRVKPTKAYKDLADYMYLKPGRTRENPGTLNEDFFINHNEVVDYCHKHRDYPEFSSDESTVAESPRELVEKFLPDEQPAKSKNKKKSHKKKKTKKTPRNYTFGVLWVRHLQPFGWQVERGRDLVDWYYVKPNCSRKGGTLNEDFFDSNDAVIQWCKDNDYYPGASSPSSGSSASEPETPSHRSTATDADTRVDDDESTKMPAETEDEHTTASTPNRRPEPQDPGKPRLEEDEDEVVEESLEDRYQWDILWPRLKKSGWHYTRAKNKLEDWWFFPPRKPNFDGSQPEELIKGKTYFNSEEAVISYMKELDLELGEIKASDFQQVQKVATESSGDTKKKRQSNSTATEPSKKANGISKAARAEAKRLKAAEEEIQRKAGRSSEDALYEETAVLKVDESVPWQQIPIVRSGLHSLCCDVGGLGYVGSTYYLPGENHKNASVRFEDVEQVRKYFCRLGRESYPLSKETRASEQDIEEFHRWIDHAFVPGKWHEHAQIRGVSRKEMLQALKVYGFEECNGAWTPPPHLIDGVSEIGVLEGSYSSLDDLLPELRRVETFSHDPEGRGRRRAGKTSMVSDKANQILIAVRLSIAEGYFYEEKTRKPKKKRNIAVAIWEGKKSLKRQKGYSADVFDFDRECEKSQASSSGSNRSAKKRSGDRAIEAKPSQKKSRSESGKYRKFDNPNELKVMVPQGTESFWEYPDIKDLFKVVATPLDVKFSGGRYKLPDGPASHLEFGSVEEILIHFATFGGYKPERHGETARKEVDIRMRYAHVPVGEWKKIRLLENYEAAFCLNLLGFQGSDGSEWTVPTRLLDIRNDYVEGRPSLLQLKYPSLLELKVALRGMPALQTGRSSASCPLNKYQLLALRLWIAYEPSSRAYATNESTTKPEDMLAADGRSNSNTEGSRSEVKDLRITNVAINDSSDDSSNEGGEEVEEHARTKEVLNADAAGSLLDSVCTQKKAWEYFQKIGVTYVSGEYRTPNKKVFDFDGLCESVLENSIVDFQFDLQNKLTRDEFNEFHRYLKFKNMPLKRGSPVYEVQSMISKIEGLLKKIGVTVARSHGGQIMYEVVDKEGNTGGEITHHDLINHIRKSKTDLASSFTKTSRRRAPKVGKSSLSDAEDLAIRLWAAEDETPLQFFDIDEWCKENSLAGVENPSSLIPEETEEIEETSSDMIESNNERVSPKGKHAIDQEPGEQDVLPKPNQSSPLCLEANGLNMLQTTEATDGITNDQKDDSSLPADGACKSERVSVETNVQNGNSVDVEGGAVIEPAPSVESVAESTDNVPGVAKMEGSDDQVGLQANVSAFSADVASESPHFEDTASKDTAHEFLMNEFVDMQDFHVTPPKGDNSDGFYYTQPSSP